MLGALPTPENSGGYSMADRYGTQIPYVRQGDSREHRMCGAAALSMVYQSLGRDVTQDEIWANIKAADRRGAMTHTLAADALSRDFSALIVQLERPLEFLKTCQAHGVRVVLNHRLKPSSAAGHFTVLADLTADQVVLHDPQLGPAQWLRFADLLDLWQPRPGVPEVRGNIAVAIADGRKAEWSCPVCQTAVPESITCAGCRQTISLHPRVVLGCVRDDCAGRTWTQLFCPRCDASQLRSTAAETPKMPSGPKPDLAKLSGFIDQFRATILANVKKPLHPQLARQLDALSAEQSKLKDVQFPDPPPIIPPKAPTLPPRTAVAPTPAPVPPPPDGNVLAQKLLVAAGLKVAVLIAPAKEAKQENRTPAKPPSKPLPAKKRPMPPPKPSSTPPTGGEFDSFKVE
jgi:hypothetical protein